MFLNSFEALNAFAKQLERNIAGKEFKTKVIITPSSVNEPGVVIKVSLLKTFIPTDVPASKSSRMLRVRVSVCGRAESMTGLRQALEAIEALDRYLISDGLRLEKTEDWGPVKIPYSRIIQYVSEEDSFMDDVDSIKVQDVQDHRIVIITIPNNEGEN